MALEVTFADRLRRLAGFCLMCLLICFELTAVLPVSWVVFVPIIHSYWISASVGHMS